MRYTDVCIRIYMCTHQYTNISKICKCMKIYKHSWDCLSSGHLWKQHQVILPVGIYFDWCCFYYFVRNSLVALLEARSFLNFDVLLWGDPHMESQARTLGSNHTTRVLNEAFDEQNFFEQKNEPYSLVLHIRVILCTHLQLWMHNLPGLPRLAGRTHSSTVCPSIML